MGRFQGGPRTGVKADGSQSRGYREMISVVFLRIEALVDFLLRFAGYFVKQKP